MKWEDIAKDLKHVESNKFTSSWNGKDEIFVELDFSFKRKGIINDEFDFAMTIVSSDEIKSSFTKSDYWKYYFNDCKELQIMFLEDNITAELSALKDKIISWYNKNPKIFFEEITEKILKKYKTEIILK